MADPPDNSVENSGQSAVPDNELVPAVARRQLSKAEWQELKPLIHRLYIEEGRSLKNVAQSLAEEQGFYPTKKQLR